MRNPYSLFACTPVAHPSYTPDLVTRLDLKGKVGYFTTADAFIRADLNVDLFVELLRSCGFCAVRTPSFFPPRCGRSRMLT